MSTPETTPDFTRPPTAAEIRAAAARLAGRVVRTPLLESPELSEQLGFRLLLKAECLQRAGAFKFRGALNRMDQIPADQRAGGVVAFSSGNHAQGVAAAAKALSMPAVIVMPADAPAVKLAATRALGGEVVTYDRVREDREAIGAALAAEHGAALVKPFDDGGVIAGQATVGLEIAAQAAEIGARLDTALICCSGGGLAAGIALALEMDAPGARVRTAEPTGFDDAARSLAAGRLEEPNAQLDGSICDALLAPQLGRIPWEILRDRAGPGLSADDDAARRAMAAALRHFRLVLEPGGAIALACALTHAAQLRGQTVAVVASGGNVDPLVYADAIARFS